MAHRRSDSRFSLASRTPSPMSSTFTLAAISSPLLAISYPRKSKMYRTIFLALFALIIVSTYIFFVARPALAHAPISLHADSSGGGSGRRITKDLPHSRLFQLPPSPHQKSPTAAASEKPRLQLDRSQELAAVSSFLASLPQNVIPSTIDPSRPIDPQLVLDFDTRGPRAVDELKQIVDDVWAQNPVMLYSQLQGPHSREVTAMLVHMNLSPPPMILEVDQRDDGNVLTPLLLRITSSAELPILLVGGKPVGTTSEIAALFRSRELHKMVTDAGAIVDGTPRRRKGRK